MLTVGGGGGGGDFKQQAVVFPIVSWKFCGGLRL